MTTPKFTPGPWTVERGEKCLFIYDSREDVPSIAHLGRTGMDHDDEANATLIASAPALYAALEDAADDFTDIRMILQSPVAGSANERLAAIEKLVNRSRDKRQSALALARGEKGGE